MSGRRRQPKYVDEDQTIYTIDAEFGMENVMTALKNSNVISVLAVLAFAIATASLVMTSINTDKRLRVLDPFCDTCFAPVDVNLRPFTYVIYVDGGADNGGVDPDGSIRYPFTTIQDALDTIPAASSALDSRKSYMIKIMAGNYDEDLLIVGSKRRIILYAEGQVTLGNITGSSWSYDSAADTARTITWNATSEFTSVPNSLVITGSVPESEGALATDSFTSKFRISGGLDIVSNVTLADIHVNAEIFGTLTIGNTATTNLYLHHSRVRGVVTGGSNTQFQVCEMSTFDALVTVGKYGSMRMCNFAAGMTVSSATALTAKPDGFVSSRLVGTFTGPANSLRLDAYTNYVFVTASGVLGGSASKVIMNSTA
jgi:hypothetical protein